MACDTGASEWHKSTSFPTFFTVSDHTFCLTERSGMKEHKKSQRERERDRQRERENEQTNERERKRKGRRKERKSRRLGGALSPAGEPLRAQKYARGPGRSLRRRSLHLLKRWKLQVQLAPTSVHHRCDPP